MLPFVYWINLARSTERRERMRSALDRRGLKNTRIEAVDGTNAIALDAALRGRRGRPTEAACIASHLRAVKQAWDDGRELALVLEDDASFAFVDRWPDGWRHLSSLVPRGFGLLQLCVGEEPKRLDRLYRLADDVVRFDRHLYWSTVAYAIDRAGMAAVLAAFSRDGHFDVSAHTGPPCCESVLMDTLAADPTIDGPFVARIPLFTYEPGVSEIHSDHHGHQERARAFMLAHHEALLSRRYRSPFSARATVTRWLQAQS